ncbi:T7SS effector LXG polymorphic toxin [Bacillus sp. HSf4]|uniref:ribonuclease YeeF family protein n=1 Tax=Bacillus sp. HSf4 TaxID=3035514 RepID=UPI00240953B9|nr:T7SS effector LXG polymorphic toxin [Bacillus sp. HSf4]WFA06336.1 T7SS effector LXG polymorphic toxin [Bacillus sp. HSf4]
MKIFESKTLLAAMEARSKEYKSTREQFVNLKKAFQGMADLGDDFQGEGADKIKAFYRDQAGIVNDWIDLIDMQTKFLDSISDAVADAKLAGDTFVDMEFLENQLNNALKNAKAMVSHQKKDLKRILQDIHDILPLEVFSSEKFKQHINDANDERKETIKAVDDLDAALKEEYSASEINQQMVVADYTALIDATGKGKDASPIHYDAKAYRSSEAYQLKDDVHKNATNYIQFKKDQAEGRRIAKEQEELAKKQQELANRPWYEKALDAGGTFLGEISGYYDYKRAAEGVDPVTGEKLTDGERVAAGAMGAAGYIPVVGWFGKGAKGIKGAYSMYKAEKAISTADKALAAYKTPKTFQALKNSEKGLYGLAAANGFSETITGRDMFGNQISEERREQNLNNALSMLGAFGLRGVSGRLNARAPGNVTKKTDASSYRHLKVYEKNKYFKRSVEYNAGKDGTGYTYKVYQRSDVDWNMVRTKGAKKGRGLTNAEASAKYGLAPILDEKGSVATLHHSQQKGVGPLFEASTRYHNISNAKKAPLHPYKGKLNPYHPMDEGTRAAFQKVDSINYWKVRGNEALGGK